jgi:polyhydroxyalkanoate synthesis regulator phasin
VPESPDFRKYLEAAVVLGQVTRARAEEILHELAGAGELQRGQVEQWMNELVDRGQVAATGLLTLLRNQVDSLLGDKGMASVEDLMRQLGDLLTRSGGTRPTPAGDGGAEPPAPGSVGSAGEPQAATAAEPPVPPEGPAEPPTGPES